MIYFLAPVEGGSFIRIKRPSIRPKIIMKKFIKQKLRCVAVFKNGMIYDGFLFPCLTPLRHKFYRGKSYGRQYYKRLLRLDLPKEEII